MAFIPLGFKKKILDILTDTGTTLPATLATQSTQMAGMNNSVVKSDGAYLTGDDDLFDITGGPVRARIVGVVTTLCGGATNGDLQIDVTEPAQTVDLNAGAVACDNDAAGTVYTCIDTTSVFTPTTNGASIVDNVGANEATFILPVGTVIFRSSGAQSGVISWCMTYEPLTPDSVVTAAA